MTTSPCLDIDLMTPACVHWESSDAAVGRLVEPDPPTRNLSLECHFNVETTSASFTIHCPLRLKGIDSHSHILVLIPPRAITSFAFKVYPTPPEDVRKKLNCSTVRLRFGLHQRLHLVAQATAIEPIQARKRLSAEVLNSLRSLATATTLDIYVSDRGLPHIKLNALREAVSRAILKPLDPDFPNSLSTLYNGRGGKFVDLLPQSDELSACDKPPAYDELGPSPPAAIEQGPTQKIDRPSTTQHAEHNEKKRRRLDDASSSDEIDCRFDLTWAVVVKMRDEMQKLVRRVDHLEKENKELSEELNVLRASCDKANDAVDADEAVLLEVQSDLNELTDRVDFLTQNGIDSDVEKSIIKKVTSRAVANIVEKSYKISVEEDL